MAVSLYIHLSGVSVFLHCQFSDGPKKIVDFQLFELCLTKISVMTFKVLTFWSRNWKAWIYVYLYLSGFPGGSDDKESACNAEDPGLISESRRSPGKGNGNPLQYSCLENSKDRGAGGLQFIGQKNAQAYFQVGYEDEKIILTDCIDWELFNRWWSKVAFTVYSICGL